MPPEVVKFMYSRKSGYAALALLIILILLLLKTSISNYLAHDMLGTSIFGVFILFLLFLLGLMIVSRLAPALKGEVALELDENGFKDYIRNIILDWKDIEDIGLKPGRSSAMLIFELKFDSDFGKQVFVSLRWVDGRDQEIYKKVLDYFDAVEGIERVYDEEGQ
ncbi:hypothetical protein [Mucilaginibacter sp.]